MVDNKSLSRRRTAARSKVNCCVKGCEPSIRRLIVAVEPVKTIVADARSALSVPFVSNRGTVGAYLKSAGYFRMGHESLNISDSVRDPIRRRSV